MYSVVVDAGSSGSRAYVYKWPSISEVNDPQQFIIPIETHAEWVTRVEPGISSYAVKPKKEIWTDHLKPLIDGALQVIPRSERESTPIFFLATAGMRLLEENDRRQVLDNVCSLLKTKAPFAINDCSRHVSMIDGEIEGLYGWLGLNYLIHTRDNTLWTANEFPETYGFMDMGGASSQIAFVPDAHESERHHDDLYTVSLRTNTGDPLSWKLFVTTWLGFGANQAQSRWRQYLVDNATDEDLAAISHESPLVLSDPCLQEGGIHQESRTIKGDNVDTFFYGSGDFAKCEAQLETLLNADKTCKDEPCLFDGVHVPAFDVNLQKFIGVSEYWYSAQDLFHLDGKFDYATFLGKASEFCQEDWRSVENKWKEGEYGSDFDKSHLQTGCFKSAWVLTVLHKGFKFPLNPTDATGEHKFLDSFQSASQINGLELSWTLGKAIMYASSQVPSSTAHQVGFVSTNGEILTEESVLVVPRGSSYMELLVILVCIGILGWLYRECTSLRKKIRGGWDSFRNKNKPGLPELERRQWSRPASRDGTPVYPQFELNDMLPPGANRSPVFGQFREGVSSSVPVSRAPSRVGSRLNISTMQEED